jgi:hypothetical protein
MLNFTHTAATHPLKRVGVLMVLFARIGWLASRLIHL